MNENEINRLEANATTKVCPFCAETIRAEAVKCRYCGSIVESRALDAEFAALPLVVAQAYVVVESGAWLLASWVPEPILFGLGFGYLASFALGVGALYGSIPLVVAWRRRALLEWA